MKRQTYVRNVLLFLMLFVFSSSGYAQDFWGSIKDKLGSSTTGKHLLWLVEDKKDRIVFFRDEEDLRRQIAVSYDEVKELMTQTRGTNGCHWAIKQKDGNLLHLIWIPANVNADQGAVFAAHELTHARQASERGILVMPRGAIKLARYERERNIREIEARLVQGQVWDDLGRPTMPKGEDLQMKYPRLFGTAEHLLVQELGVTKRITEKLDQMSDALLKKLVK